MKPDRVISTCALCKHYSEETGECWRYPPVVISTPTNNYSALNQGWARPPMPPTQHYSTLTHGWARPPMPPTGTCGEWDA